MDKHTHKYYGGEWHGIVHTYIHIIHMVHMYIQCGEMRIWGSVRMMKIYYEMGERDYGLYLYTVEKRDN